MKLFILTLILLPFILVLGLTTAIYFKGPHFALDKLSKIAQSEFQTQIQYQKAGFIQNRGFYIQDLTVSHPKVNLKADLIELFFNWNWNHKIFELQEFNIKNSLIEYSVNLHDPTMKILDDKDSTNTTFIENWIKNPPPYFIFKRLNFTHFNFIFTENTLNQNKFQKVKRIQIQNANWSIQFQQNKNNLKNELIFNSSEILKVSIINPLNTTELQLKNIQLKLNTSTHFNDSQIWSLKVTEFDFGAKIKSLLIKHSNSQLTSEDSPFSINLKSEFQFPSFSEIDFTKPQIFSWNFKSQLNKMNLEKYNIINGKLTPLPPLFDKNFSTTLATEGSLLKSAPKIQNYDLPWTWSLKLNAQTGPLLANGQKTRIKLLTNWKESSGSIRLNSTQNSPINGFANIIFQKNQWQVDGLFDLSLNNELTSFFDAPKISGKIQIPIQFILLTNEHFPEKEISFYSDLHFDQLSFKNDKLSLNNISGNLALNEQITLDSSNLQFKDFFHLKSLRYKYYFKQNPFEKANFDRLSPLFTNANPLKIDSIFWNNKPFGAFNGIMELNQNYLSIHQISFNMNQSQATGELFIDLKPDQKRIGLLGRFSNFDLIPFLPSTENDAIESKWRSDPSLLIQSARAGLEFSFNDQLLNGRIDLNQINKSQLLLALNTLDPLFENNQYNKIRSLLDYGFPSKINLFFHHGTVDVSLDIESMGIKSHFYLPSIPIQKYINDMMTRSEIKENSE